MTRCTLKNSSTGEIVIKHLKKDQETYQSNFRDQESKAELEVQEKLSLLEWFANEYRRFGCTHLSLLLINLKRALSFVEVSEELEEYFATSWMFEVLMTFLMMEKFMTMMNINQPTSQTQVQWLSGRPSPVCEGSRLTVPLEGINFGRNLDSHG